MSHSQFHSIDLFILRHAWLNLWDKRMLLAESTRLLSMTFFSEQKKKCTSLERAVRFYSKPLFSLEFIYSICLSKEDFRQNNTNQLDLKIESIFQHRIQMNGACLIERCIHFLQCFFVFLNTPRRIHALINNTFFKSIIENKPYFRN